MSQILAKYVIRARIRVPLETDTMEGTIAEMAELLQDEKHTAETIRAAILDREERISTGIGHGVALPHCRLDELETSRLAVGVSSVGIEWKSLDAQPVRFIFAIAGSAKKPAELITLLGEISRLLYSPTLREWLKGAESVEEVYDLFRAHV